MAASVANRQPPVRHCRECGGDVYSWTEAPLCGQCIRAARIAEPVESLREFRRRLRRLGE